MKMKVEVEVGMEMEPTTPVAAANTDTHTNAVLPPPPPSPASTLKAKRFPQQQQQQRLGGGEKHLTRRQRKALGLPKPRNVPYLAAGGGGGKASAGKIVIPGGRWTGRAPTPADVGNGAVADPSSVQEEWRRNGTGRLDVRGFRELKI